MSAAASGQAPRFAEVHEGVPRSTDHGILAAADFDGDGVKDLLRTDGVLLNDGNGRFAPSGFAPSTLFIYATRVAIVDLDSDGDLDVARLDGWNATPTLAYNNGVGAFTAGPTLQFPAAGPRREVLIAGDVNGDGRPDLLGATHDPATGGVVVAVWTNLGGGAFIVSTFAGGSVAAEPLAAGDLDGDGKDEVLLDDYGASGLSSLRFASWSGTAWVVGPVVFGPAFYVSAHFTDWTGDGLADLLAWRASYSSSTAGPVGTTESLFLGTPAGLAPPVVRLAALFPDRVLRLELDGAPPFEVLREWAASSVVVGLPSVLVQPPTPVPVLPGDASPTIVADFDGDGDDDVLGMTTSGAPRTSYNFGGAFAEPDGAFPARFDVFRRSVLAMDVDGDGAADVVAGDFASAARNDGTGAFAVVAATPPNPPPPLQTAPCCIADFNGDGAEDAYLAFGGGAHWCVYGSPSFAFTATTIPAPATKTRSVVAGDLDADGDVDLAIAFESPARLEVRLNDGGGAWSVVMLEAARRVRDVALADVDDDGDLDVVAACRALSSPFPIDASLVYVNQGGAFVAQSLPFVVEADAVAAGDVDGDGDADLVFGGVAYLRSGGTYVAAPGVALDPEGQFGAAVVDVDGDGSAEFCSRSGFAAGLGVGGFGASTEWPAPMGFLSSPYELWALVPRMTPRDFDRDGDPDFLSTSPALMTNLTGQLSRGTHARPGRPAILDLAGPPGAPYFVFLAASRLTPPIEFGWGPLHLDPSTAQSWFVGAFDGAGRAAAGLIVPNVPALVGLTLWWQAALPTEARLTNAVQTTVLGF